MLTWLSAQYNSVVTVNRDREISVSTGTRLRTGQWRNRYSLPDKSVRIFFISTPVRKVFDIYSSGIKLPEHEANQLSQSNCEFNRARSYIYALPIPPPWKIYSDSLRIWASLSVGAPIEPRGTWCLGGGPLIPVSLKDG